MSVQEIKAIAKSLGIKGYYNMKKMDLIMAIENLKDTTSDGKPKKQEEPVLSGSIHMTDDQKPEKQEVRPEVKARRSNAWNEHIRAYRQEHGCSLREAMAGARATYGKKPE